MIMDRCIVKGCAAGSLNKTNNIRQKLLFKVPNDPNELGKWCTVLGQILEPGDKVCDIHFKEDDILKNLSTFTKLEGQKTLMFKKRVKLKKGAIPISVEDPLEIEEPCIYEIDDEEQLSEDAVENNDVIEESNAQLPQPCNGNDAEESKRVLEVEDVFSETDEEDIILIPCEENSSKVLQQSPKGKVVDSNRKNGVIANQVIESKSEPNVTDNGIKRVGRKRKIKRPFPAKNKLTKNNTDSGENSFTQNKIRKTVYSYSPTKLFDCFDELKYIVQQKAIRQQWCAKVEQNNVFFSYVDFELSRVNCCLKVSDNFKVNAYTADKVIAIYVATTGGVKCVAEIIEIMKVLEKKRWCLGPGIPYVNRSPDCIGAMPVKSASDSCTACVKEKLNSLSHTRELANCRIKLEEARHKCELWRKKHHYANTQYERLKAENKILEFQVDEAKKVAINEVLDRLPTLQQCVVRYIIHASYTVKSSLRYSDVWVNECHIMRSMNISLYEYMRHKEILPLPCLDTLRKHKIKPAIENEELPEPIPEEDPLGSSKLPELVSPDEIPDPLIIIKTVEDTEIPVIAEPLGETETSEIPIIIETTELSETIPQSIEISETEAEVTAELPESTNPNDYNMIDVPVECIISEEVAYEETVCTEPNEEEQ